MNLVFEGVKMGMLLCIMAGPIFFTLLQTGVEEGLRAGLVVGTGIWLSDLLIVLMVYWGLAYVREALASDAFTLIVGLSGGLILLVFGLATFLVPPKNVYVADFVSTQRTSSYLSLWLKGFLINSINPFTLFFWVGLMSTVVLRNEMAGGEASLFFTGLLGTIVVTDFLKVAMAKKIRYWLKPIHLIWFRKIAGIALIGFGLVLLIRTLLLY